MIYLDSAATTLQKPPQVASAMAWAVGHCASPGRGGYPPSVAAAELAFHCRERLGEMLDAPGPESVIFTSSATQGLNIAIRSLVHPGDRVVLSGYEHNAVTRTLESIPGVDSRVAFQELFSPEGDLDAFRRLVEEDTAAVICTHVSNVFGYVLPVEEIARLCKERGVPLIVDASQSAGVLEVSAGGWGAAYVALPGHKGLYGPQGTGVLICGRDADPLPLLTGGTGSSSREQQMPQDLPDRLEPGTHNMPGIAGLYAGAGWVMGQGRGRILAHERAMANQLIAGLRSVRGAELFVPQEPEQRTGVVSFRLAGVDCETAAEALGRRGICVRAGLHCAPLAHRSAGTLDTGTIRASVSAFTTSDQIRRFVAAVGGMTQK